MSKFTITRSSVIKAKHLTESVENDLRIALKQFADEMDIQLNGLSDAPVEIASDELIWQIKEILDKLSSQFGDIQDFCDRVIIWLDQRESY